MNSVGQHVLVSGGKLWICVAPLNWNSVCKVECTCVIVKRNISSLPLRWPLSAVKFSFLYNFLMLCCQRKQLVFPAQIKEVKITSQSKISGAIILTLVPFLLCKVAEAVTSFCCESAGIYWKLLHPMIELLQTISFRIHFCLLSHIGLHPGQYLPERDGNLLTMYPVLSWYVVTKACASASLVLFKKKKKNHIKKMRNYWFCNYWNIPAALTYFE